MKKKFNKIYVEITNICNLKCSFCSLDNLPKKEMQVEEFKKVIDKVKDYTSSIYLHIKGEPLMHSHLDEILTICDENKINVKITTNGTLLKKQKEILLKHQIKQINVSLHSENTIPDYFKQVFETVDELKKKVTVVYRIWTLNNLKIEQDTMKIIDEIKKYYQIDESTFKKILYDKNIQIQDNLYLDKDIEFTWPSINNNQDNYGTCLGTRSHIGILVDGTVVPCCLDSKGIIELGNIHESDLATILQSDLFKKMNEGFLKHQLVCDLCKSCFYRQRFDKSSVK